MHTNYNFREAISIKSPILTVRSELHSYNRERSLVHRSVVNVIKCLTDTSRQDASKLRRMMAEADRYGASFRRSGPYFECDAPGDDLGDHSG